MKKSTNIPPLSRADKLCVLLAAGCFLAPHLACWAMDEAAIRAAEATNEPPAITAAAPAIDFTPLAEAIEARRVEIFWESVPLDQECQKALQEACDAHGVPLCLALGLIEVESGFRADADNGVSVGLMQLNRRYFPDDLTPEENIQAGVAHLGGLLERCEDTQQALTFYNVGHDNGSRQYARAVLAAAEKWGAG